MGIGVKLSVVEEWLNQTQGLEKVRFVDSRIEPITDEQILKLAKNCTWATFSIESDLFADNLYPTGLIMGSGEMLERCHLVEESVSSQVFFINACY